MAAFAKSLIVFVALNLLFLTLVSACGDCGSGTIPKPPKHTPTPYYPAPGGGSSGNPPFTGNCPKDTLKLGVCANVLNLLKLNIGNPPTGDLCCPLIQGLIDAEAAVCLCTNIKLGLLGLNLNIPVDLSLLVNYCGRTLPRGFQCF